MLARGAATGASGFRAKRSLPKHLRSLGGLAGDPYNALMRSSLGSLNKTYRHVKPPAAMRIPSLANVATAARAALLLLAVAPVALAPCAMAQSFDIFGGDKFGDSKFGDGLDAFSDPAGDPVTMSAQFTTASGERPAVLMVTADIQPGWHVYSLTQPSGGPLPTEIKLPPSDQYQVMAPSPLTPCTSRGLIKRRGSALRSKSTPTV